MEKFKLVPSDKKVFAKLIEDFDGSNELLQKSFIKYVIVVPENKSWKIYLSTPENLSTELLQGVESFGKMERWKVITPHSSILITH